MPHQLHRSPDSRRPTNLGLRITFTVVILLLAGCSLLQITYNKLNWVILWYVDDYITLNNQQEMLLDELIEKELRWHRKTQLPLYAQWLKELSRDVESGFTNAKVARHLARFEQFRKTLMQETATHVATLLATVSDRQIDEIFVNFEKYNRDFFDRYIGKPAAELQRNRLDRMEGLFAGWLGPLTKTQRAAIDHWSRQRGSIASEVNAYRKQWQAKFRTVLSHRKDLKRLTKGMQLLLVEPHLNSPPSYLAKRKRNIELGKELFIAVMHAATPAQRARLRHYLEGYARDFEQLSLQT